VSGLLSDRGRRPCADGYWGSPETWEALLFPREESGRETGIPTLGPLSGLRWRREARNVPQATRGTAERREPKRGGMDNRESERPDSTGDVGELAAQRGPGGGKRGVT
jgi:hypothetical protein